MNERVENDSHGGAEIWFAQRHEATKKKDFAQRRRERRGVSLGCVGSLSFSDEGK
jgi:hypothetical protein